MSPLPPCYPTLSTPSHWRLLAISAVAASLMTTGFAEAKPYDGPRVAHTIEGEQLPLFAVPDKFTVTRAPGVSDSWDPTQESAAAPSTLEAGPYVLIHQQALGAPRYRTDLYRLEPQRNGTRAAAGEVARALMTLPEVIVAGPLYRRSHRPAAPWRAMTPTVLLQLNSREDLPALQRLAATLGVQTIEPRGLAPHQYRFALPPRAPVDPVEAAMTLQDAPFTRWAQVDWLEPRAARFVPSDERFEDQWHHDNTGQANGIADNDVNSPEAWETTLGNPEVIIAVLDSGIDLDHPDLASDLVPGYDFVDGDDDPSSTDSHGTKVAGTSAAPAQGVGVVGTCPGCSIMPIRMLGISHQGEADAHDFAVAHGAWVINNSWGPVDGTGEPTALPAVVATAIDYATDSGREGRGIPIFWAAGNGHPTDTCSDDGYVAYPSTIAIGGSTNEGEHGDGYSELCPELDFSAPSSGGTIGLTTTTINDDGYTSSFGGTSGAAPVASGVGGLALSAFPELTWDGLRSLLQETAQKIDPGDAFYNDAGRSNAYGYGRIDAGAALSATPSVLSVTPLMANCSSQLTASLLLPNKAGLGTLPVLASSDTEQTPDLFMLQEDEAGSYFGVIPLVEDDPVEGDDRLSVSHGDLVSISSTEVEDDAEIDVDCRAPEIIEPNVLVIGAHDARIQWQTDEAADGWVIWTDEAGNDYGNTTEAIGVEHEVWANGLEPCAEYTASIGVTDSVDNVAEEEGVLSWRTEGDPDLLPDGTPEEADPCDPSTWGDGGSGNGGGSGTLQGSSDTHDVNGCHCSTGSAKAGTTPGLSFALGLSWLVALLGCRRRSS